MKLILASASPRRRELLNQMGLEFEIRVTDCNEDCALTKPAELVAELSRRKALAVLGEPVEKPEILVVGADTVVAMDGKIFGKPKSPEDAVETLLALSGRTHSVFTGLTVAQYADFEPDMLLCSSEALETRVTFAEITRAEAEAYVATGEPLDKAGSYGIQGRGGVFVERIDGDYYNVIGLPISRLYRMLRDFHYLP